jgi:AraC-like DNA-binding protein
MSQPSYEELMLKELMELSTKMKEDTGIRNTMITYLFNKRNETKMTASMIARSAGISRKHVYTIAKERGIKNGVQF